jgi:hypothetical protein
MSNKQSYSLQTRTLIQNNTLLWRHKKVVILARDKNELKC